MRSGTCCLAWVKARNDAILKSSEPQNRIRNGSAVFAVVELYLRHVGAANERTGAQSLQSMAEGTGELAGGMVEEAGRHGDLCLAHV